MVEDWETSCLDRKCPSQVSYIYNSLISYQVWSVCVESLLGGGVQVINRDRPGNFSSQDGYSVGQNGKCVRQAVETHYRMFSRCAEPKSGYRVEIGW